jgi:hypothetical protein
MKKQYRSQKRKRGGSATVMPLQYYKPDSQTLSAPAGGDLLKAELPTMVRPKIGGRRRRTAAKQKKRSYRGGFVPSVMGGFMAAAEKYIVPIALYAGYKFMTRKARR